MERTRRRIRTFITSLEVGWFLAYRQVRRSSIATTILIIFVMMLTFLNLVVVRGVLVGLIQGSTNVYSSSYSGEVLLSTLPKKDFIENSRSIEEIAKNLPWTEGITARYLQGAKIEAGYKERVKLSDKANIGTGNIAGIDPVAEDAVTHISGKMVEGSFLTPSDTDSIVLGADLLKKYVPVESPGIALLENVNVGDRVRVTLGDNVQEFTVKGIIQSKVGEIDARVFMLDSILRGLIGRSDYNVDEIAMRLKPGSDPIQVKNALLASGVGETARVQTADEALPKFLIDIKNTFAILGNVIGSIGLVVASITIFIVIFVNAITRRKYIGILKGIGIDSVAVEFAYVLQSVFYAGLGIMLGLIILYGFLVPFVAVHPIKFPFSDGILVAEFPGTMLRAFLLMIATLIAGYIPARIVVKQNTLDAILGRK